MSGEADSSSGKRSDRETRGIGNMLQNAGQSTGSTKRSKRSARPNRNPFGEGSYEEAQTDQQQEEEPQGGPANEDQESLSGTNTVERSSVDARENDSPPPEEASEEEPQDTDSSPVGASAEASTEASAEAGGPPASAPAEPKNAGVAQASQQSGQKSADVQVSGRSQRSVRSARVYDEDWPVPEGVQTPLVRRSGEPNVQSQFLLPETHAWVIDEMRARLKRPPYRYTKRQASQSNVVAMAIEHFYEELMGEPLPQPDDPELDEVE